MLPTFVIGLREGLEASLIVGIIAAFLSRRGERRALRPMWLGVGIAAALCVAAAVILQVVDAALPSKQREGMEGALALVAVLGVTYMVVWMHRHSGELKGMLEQSAEHALVVGSAVALSGMAFFAVLREGLETAIFMLAAFQSSVNVAATGAGAVLGVAVAIGLGYGIYKGGVRVNLSRFFRATGFVLVLVAAGLLASAAHAFAEAGVLTTFQSPALDLTWLVGPGTVRAALITGMLGLQPVPTLAESVAWLLYAVPMGLYVIWPSRPGRPSTKVLLTGVVVALALAGPACGKGSGETGSSKDAIQVSLKDFDLTLSRSTAPAGEITLQAANDGPSVHEFEVFSVSGDVDPDDLEVRDGVALADRLTLVEELEDIVPGAAPELTLDLQPGVYAVICNLPGHYQQGTHATLTVG